MTDNFFVCVFKLTYRAFIFDVQHHPEVLYQCCLNYAPGVKIDPAPVGHNFTFNYIRKTLNDFLS